MIDPVTEDTQGALFGDASPYKPARPDRVPARVERTRYEQGVLLTPETLTESVDVAAQELF